MQTDTCDLKINNTRISENDAVQLQLLILYLQKRVEWLTSAPRFAEFCQPVAFHTDCRDKTNKTVSRKPLLTNGANPAGTRIIDYLMYSLSLSGGNELIITCFNNALEMGFKPGSSKNPHPSSDEALKSFVNIARGTRYKKWVEVRRRQFFLTKEGEEQLAFLKEHDLIPQKVLETLEKKEALSTTEKPHSQNVLPYNQDATAS